MSKRAIYRWVRGSHDFEFRAESGGAVGHGSVFLIAGLWAWEFGTYRGTGLKTARGAASALADHVKAQFAPERGVIVRDWTVF